MRASGPPGKCIRIPGRHGASSGASGRCRRGTGKIFSRWIGRLLKESGRTAGRDLFSAGGFSSGDSGRRQSLCAAEETDDRREKDGEKVRDYGAYARRCIPPGCERLPRATTFYLGAEYRRADTLTSGAEVWRVEDSIPPYLQSVWRCQGRMCFPSRRVLQSPIYGPEFSSLTQTRRISANE